MKSHIEIVCLDNDNIEQAASLIHIDHIELVEQPNEKVREQTPECKAVLWMNQPGCGQFSLRVRNSYESIRNQLAIKRDRHADRSDVRER